MSTRAEHLHGFAVNSGPEPRIHTSEQLSRLHDFAPHIDEKALPSVFGLREIDGVYFNVQNQGRFMLGVYSEEPDELSARMPLAFSQGTNYLHVTETGAWVVGATSRPLSEASAELLLTFIENGLAELEAATEDFTQDTAVTAVSGG